MKLFFGFLLLVGCTAPVAGQVRVVTYNTLDGPTPGVHDNSANMQTIFGAIASQSVNGIAKRPDLIILQEQTTTSAAALATLLNAQFAGASYVAVTPSGQPGSSDPVFIDRQSFVYDTSMLTAIGSAISIPTGAHRPVIRGQFRPVGYTAPGASFYAYGAHLMSGSASDRSLQTNAMRSDANGLGNAHILFAGDFNMQANTETAWQNLVTGTGPGLAVDPLNPSNASQTWNNNAAFASIHTQSTRTGATPDGDQGATGGMDDRFDVQLFTEEFNDGEGLAYIPGSYRAFGNDGLHFNTAINASPTIPLGSTVANALWDASDHLPVVADYQVPAKGALTQSIAAPSTVIVGAVSQATFNVRNSAAVAVAAAADELDYTFSTTGSVTVSFSGTALATQLGNNHVVSFNTTTPGAKNIVTLFSTTSEGASLTGGLFQASTMVVAHATPSFDAGTLTTARTIDLGIWGVGETVPFAAVSLHNRADPSGFTAGLDLDSILASGDAATLPLTLSPGGPSIAPGASRSGTVGLASTTVGLFTAGYALQLSDQDLPGATTLATLTLNVTGRIALFGDATLNNTVNLDDFTALAAAFGQTGQTWQTGDFTHDGSVNLDDFTILAANFGQSAIDLPRSVPEPSIAIVFVSVVPLFSRRSRMSREAAAEDSLGRKPQELDQSNPKP